ncbi:MAG: bacteriorhodopsin [Pseudomonadota bacterium]
MPILSYTEYNIIYNLLSFAIAAMMASFVFFVLVRELVAKHYRIAIIVSALVVFIAAYHYFRIFNSFSGAYAFNVSGGDYNPTGKIFNDAYRYVDWILTVPLLLVELVAVLNLESAKSRSLLIRLIVAALLMIGLGYPGEISQVIATKTIFFILSCIPFVYILYVLWVEITHSIANQPESVRALVSATRIILVVTWLVYPIAYLFKMGETVTAFGQVGVQVGYTIADVLSKCFYGLFIFLIAYVKTKYDKKLEHHEAGQ